MPLFSLLFNVNGSTLGIRALCVWGMEEGYLVSAPWGSLLTTWPPLPRNAVAEFGHTLCEMIRTRKSKTRTSFHLGRGPSKTLGFQQDLFAKDDTFPCLFLDCLASR